jgi:hypothetical protein
MTKVALSTKSIQVRNSTEERAEVKRLASDADQGRLAQLSWNQAGGKAAPIVDPDHLITHAPWDLRIL